MTLMASPLARAKGERMGLIDDDELRAGADEVVAAVLGLDEVGRDDDVRVLVEERPADRKAALEAPSGGGQNELSVEMELLDEFVLPLLSEMGRAEHGQALDVTAIEERKAELRARRLKEQAARSPHHVYKSDRYWIDHPRFHIPQQVFNGNFSAFQIRTQFPQHYRWFLEVNSARCEPYIPKPRMHKTIITQPVRTDKWGNTTAVGEPKETHIYIEMRFFPKYEEYEKLIGWETLRAFTDLFFGGDVDKSQERFLEIGWSKVKEVVGLTYAWKKFFNEHECTSATLFQMRENMWRAATGQPSLQAAGVPVANAAAETEPLVPAPEDMTIFDGCYEDHEYKKREFCMCMDEQAQRAIDRRQRDARVLFGSTAIQLFDIGMIHRRLDDLGDDAPLLGHAHALFHALFFERIERAGLEHWIVTPVDGP